MPTKCRRHAQQCGKLEIGDDILSEHWAELAGARRPSDKTDVVGTGHHKSQDVRGFIRDARRLQVNKLIGRYRLRGRLQRSPHRQRRAPAPTGGRIVSTDR